MKSFTKLLLAPVLAIILISCDTDHDGEIQSVDAKKIDSVRIAADTMAIGRVQEIRIFSTYTKNCEGFYGNDYIPQDSIRTVINYSYKTNNPCGADQYAAFNIIRFAPIRTGKYYFKFWTGKDTAGQNTWIEKQVVVR